MSPTWGELKRLIDAHVREDWGVSISIDWDTPMDRICIDENVETEENFVEIHSVDPLRRHKE